MSGFRVRLVEGPYNNDTVVGDFRIGEAIVVGEPGYEATYEYIGSAEAVFVPDTEDNTLPEAA